MEQVNPGIAKGYALDFASPLRFVAEQLHAGPRTLDELAERYEHERDDLARVWDHELRERGQRRSAREQVQAQRETDAKRWLIEAAIAALGTQLRQDGDRFALAVPIEAIRFRGIPVVMPATPTEGRTASQRSKRARTGRGGAPAAEAAPQAPVEAPAEAPAPAPEPEPEPEPPQPHPLRQWIERNGYTAPRLARALGVERREITAYLDGGTAVPRVVWLALWALERGAEI